MTVASADNLPRKHTTLRLVASVVLSGFLGSGADEVWHQIFAMAPVVYNRLLPTQATHVADVEPTGNKLPRADENSGARGN